MCCLLHAAEYPEIVMPLAPNADGILHHRLRTASGRMFWFGAALVVLGVGAIAFPMLSTMVAAMLVGWVLLISGVILLGSCFALHGTGPFFGALLLSLLTLFSGAYLLVNPIGGASVITLMMGVIFLFQGVFEISFAFAMRPNASWVGMLLSGIASLVIATLIIVGWPAVSVVVLGILLGVNLISSGVGYIVVSQVLK
jgi:uncharacterized membrane protein HdeD (DUF308 family)